MVAVVEYLATVEVLLIAPIGMWHRLLRSCSFLARPSEIKFFDEHVSSSVRQWYDLLCLSMTQTSVLTRSSF